MKPMKLNRDTKRASTLTPIVESLAALNPILRTHVLMNALRGLCPYSDSNALHLNTLLKAAWQETIQTAFPSNEIRIVLHPRPRDSTAALITNASKKPDIGGLLSLFHHLQRRSQSGSVHTINSVHRFVIRVLRHSGRQEGVSINREGWASICSLLAAINSRSMRFELWRDWTDRDLQRQASLDNFERIQIQDTSIRANYGHSLDGVLSGVEAEPPPVLFHGTATERLPGIESSGLHANGRYLVHLTSDSDYANHVATGFDDPAVLQVDTKLAQNEQTLFWQATQHVWQSTQISTDCISVIHPT